jgi:hypothetical protein
MDLAIGHFLHERAEKWALKVWSRLSSGKENVGSASYLLVDYNHQLGNHVK